MVLVLRFGFGVVAKTASRPCVVRLTSLSAGDFLLLAQKKVTKEKGTLAHPCARPFGLFLRLLAAAERGPGRAERGSPCRRSKHRIYPTRSSFRRKPESILTLPLPFALPGPL